MQLRGRQTQFYIDVIYGIGFAGAFAYLLFVDMDPRIAAFQGGLVLGYILRVWENMTIYERILHEEVAAEAEVAVAEEAESAVAEEVEYQLPAAAETEVARELEEQVSKEVDEAVAEEAEEAVADEIEEEVEERLEAEIDERVAEEVEEKMDDRPSPPKRKRQR